VVCCSYGEEYSDHGLLGYVAVVSSRRVSQITVSLLKTNIYYEMLCWSSTDLIIWPKKRISVRLL
jgi:hypothetical protein